MAVTSYRGATSYEGGGVLVNTKVARLNTTRNRNSTVSKPTFVKPSFVPDPRIILGSDPRIVYTAVQAKPQFRNPAHRELRRNTSTATRRNLALAHISRPLRAPHDTTPRIPSSLSKVMAASHQEAEAVASTPSLTLVTKPSRVDNALPAEQLPSTKNSLGRRALFSAKGSTSTFQKHSIVKNYSHNNSKNTSVAAPPSLSSSDSDTMVECEARVSTLEDMNGTSGSLRRKTHLDSNANMSSPIIRPTRASLLREKHSKSAINDVQDYTLSVPQSGRRTVSSDHISSQKNGSPVARRGRAGRSISLDANQDKDTEKGNKTLTSRFSPEPAVSSHVNSTDQEFTLVGNEEEGTGIVMNGSGTVSSMRQRVTRLGVGPTMRLARDAGKVIFGCPTASTAADEVQNVSSANNNEHIDKSHLKHSAAAPFMTNKSVDANKQPTRQLTRKHKARSVSRDFEKLFRPETHPPAYPVQIVPHPPRKSSLPTSPEDKLPVANASSNQSSVFSRLARPTASSSARTNSSLTKMRNINAGTDNKRLESDVTTSKDAAKKSSRIPGNSLAKSETVISVKNARKGIRERFSAMVRSGRQSRAEHNSAFSNSTQGSSCDSGVAIEEEASIIQNTNRKVSPTTAYNPSGRKDTNDEVLNLYYNLPEGSAGGSGVINTIAEGNVEDSDNTYSTGVVANFKEVVWDHNTLEVADNKLLPNGAADSTIIRGRVVESNNQKDDEPEAAPISSAGAEAAEATRPHDIAFINVEEDATREEVGQVDNQDSFVVHEGTSQVSTTPKANRRRSYSFPRPPSAAAKRSHSDPAVLPHIPQPSHNPQPSHSPQPSHPAPEPHPANKLIAFDTALSRSTSVLLTIVDLARHTNDPRTCRNLRQRIPDIHNTIAAAQNARIALQHAQQAYEGLVVTSITMSGEALTSRSVAGNAHNDEHQLARAEALETQQRLFAQLAAEQESTSTRDADLGQFNSYLQAQLVQQIQAHQSQVARGHGHGHGHARESSRESEGLGSP